MTVRRGACCLEGELTILQVEPDRDSCNILHGQHAEDSNHGEKCCWQHGQNRILVNFLIRTDVGHELNWVHLIEMMKGFN